MKKFYIGYIYETKTNGSAYSSGYQTIDAEYPDIESFMEHAKKMKSTEMVILLSCIEVDKDLEVSLNE